ncbi:hypothetical protein LMG29739_01956 [Paraburkholderia solisilvae]|uniref:Uncharacterized protein n=1 Tax=Paraburkholderia solisilvae TaxID=624376 RepID=A0A6J5DMX3_9BURK|nr:hypothetical protein LMG29739_01956 [Paraburkholderia solisilvae]
MLLDTGLVWSHWKHVGNETCRNAEPLQIHTKDLQSGRITLLMQSNNFDEEYIIHTSQSPLSGSGYRSRGTLYCFDIA